MISVLTLREARERLRYWRRGGDSFTCKLYELISKADASNRFILGAAFPNEFKAWLEWYSAESEEVWERQFFQ